MLPELNAAFEAANEAILTFAVLSDAVILVSVFCEPVSDVLVAVANELAEFVFDCNVLADAVMLACAVLTPDTVACALVSEVAKLLVFVWVVVRALLTEANSVCVDVSEVDVETSWACVLACAVLTVLMDA
jgi:hypothetical protein